MSNINPSYRRALRVFASQRANIPYPAQVTSGTNDGVVASELVDTTKDFIALGVKVGDIVYNTTGSAAATVVEVQTTVLVLNDDIFLATPNTYVVYQASEQSTIGNRGCALYIGINDNITVVTVGGDQLSFIGVKQGTILPVQIIKLISATNDSHVALW